MTSEFYAALAGAIVGGLISLALQYLSYRREDRLRKRDRASQAIERLEKKLELEAITAFSLLAKISRAHTDIGTFRNHLRAGAQRAGPKGSLALATLPLASDPPKLALTLDEMILVRDVKNDQVLNDAMNFTHVHGMYVDSMKLFRQLRHEIASLTAETQMDKDGNASSSFVGANASVAQIRQKEAEQLLGTLLNFSDADFVMINNLFHDCQRVLLDKLGKERLRTVWAVERIESPSPPP